MDFQNPSYTDTAIHRKRFKRIMDARAAPLNLIPTATEADADAGIAKVLDGLAPKNADEMALQEAEWRKVTTLIRAGRSLEQIIFSANPRRLAAIAQWIEVSEDVLSDTAPEDAITEVRELVFQQLVEAGVPEAVRARDVKIDANVVSVWRRVLLEALDEAASIGALNRLALVDIEGYRQLGIDETFERDIALDQKVKFIDKLDLRRDAVALKTEA